MGASAGPVWSQGGSSQVWYHEGPLILIFVFCDSRSETAQYGSRAYYIGQNAFREYSVTYHQVVTFWGI